MKTETTGGAFPPQQLPWFRQILMTLMARQELPEKDMTQMMQALMSGQCEEAEAAAFLVALRMKGETAQELAVAARVLREHMVHWDPGREQVLDTCGTGGDGLGTFNISTATALVVAATGVPVVKHGNRGVSSRSGSADVLTELGVRIEGDAQSARQCLERAGIAFCFAPLFHPAMRHVARVRKQLGVPTLFNCLGPLANPAGASYQLLGVGRMELLDLIAGALAHLGTGHALIVCGQDGLDEVSLSAPTHVRQVIGQQITTWQWKPTDFGLEPCDLSELQAESPQESAQIIRNVLAGNEGPPTRVVLANAAAALIAANQVSTPEEAVQRAEQALASGKAQDVLERLIEAAKMETAF